MPVDYQAANMGETVNATGTWRGQSLQDDGFGHRSMRPDPATDQPVNLMVSPMVVTRRLAWAQLVGGEQNIRLWWIATDRPLPIQEGDLLLIVEHGQTVTYTVQMVDADIYELDTTVCVCQKK